MTETNTRSIPAINSVEGFNPAEYTRALPNDDGTTSLYLDVKYRLLWFRLHRPNGKIDSEIVHVDDRFAVVCSRLYADKSDPLDQYVAKSTAQRFVSEDKFGNRYLEIAETAAIGRVLAAAGYGTQFCGATDMFSDVIADAPVEMPGNATDNAERVSNTVIPQARQEALPSNVITDEPVAPQSMPKQQKKPQSYEELLSTMTVEDAKNVVIDVGHYSGCKLGDIAIRKPSDLEWYVKFYAGRNQALKAGAAILIQAATSKAS